MGGDLFSSGGLLNAAQYSAMSQFSAMVQFFLVSEASLKGASTIKDSIRIEDEDVDKALKNKVIDLGKLIEDSEAARQLHFCNKDTVGSTLYASIFLLAQLG